MQKLELRVRDACQESVEFGMLEAEVVIALVEGREDFLLEQQVVLVADACSGSRLSGQRRS